MGKWKLNPKLSQTVLTFEEGPEGTIVYSIGGSNLRYTFATDGTHKTPAPLGKGYVIGKQVGSSTWQLTKYTETGEPIWTEAWKVAPDGKTIVLSETHSRPNDSSQSVAAILERVNGAAGLLGTWKMRLAGISYPDTFEIRTFGDNGLALLSIEYGATCRVKLDGKDYRCEGSAIPAGMMMAVKATGPRAFEARVNQNGRLLFTDKYVVAPDGRLLANESQPSETQTPLGWVYDRQ